MSRHVSQSSERQEGRDNPAYGDNDNDNSRDNQGPRNTDFKSGRGGSGATDDTYNTGRSGSGGGDSYNQGGDRNTGSGSDYNQVLGTGLCECRTYLHAAQPPACADLHSVGACDLAAQRTLVQTGSPCAAVVRCKTYLHLTALALC
jgi:hypothetical protein